MSDSPSSTPPGQQPERPTASPLPPGVGWYQGPFPPNGWNGGRESIFRALLRRSLTALVIMAAVFGSFFFFFFVIAAIGAAIGSSGEDSDPDDIETEFVAGDRDSDNDFLVIDIHGVILGEDPGGGGLFNFVTDVTYGYTVKETLRKAALDDDIKGIILDMNTPGGTIFGSHAISDGIKDYQQKTGKPVVAFVSGISASGGMWSMAPADQILADHGTLIGSIGVIMGPFTYYNGVVATDGGILGGGVTTTNGITQEYITAGRSKDVGNPYRPLTAEERATFQESINLTYSDFVKHVSENRDIPEATIRDTLGAMIFGNEKAQQLKLIDGTASREGAYASIANLARIAGNDYRIVREDDSLGALGNLFAEGDTAPAAQGICFPPNTALAYYGDVAVLCPR